MTTLAKDIKDLVEKDAHKLAEALVNGSILAGEKALSEYLTDEEIDTLVLRILRFSIDNRLLSIYIHALGSMRWLTTFEACLYSRKSLTTLKSWAEDGKIYGGPPTDGGDWVWDRVSIDDFFNTKRDERRIKVQEASNEAQEKQ